MSVKDGSQRISIEEGVQANKMAPPQISEGKA